MYSWPDVARRTAAVYDRVIAEDYAQSKNQQQQQQIAQQSNHHHQQQQIDQQGPCLSEDAAHETCDQKALLKRLTAFQKCGPVAGLLYGALALAVHLWWCFLQWQQPACRIQIARAFPSTSRRTSKPLSK